MTYIVVVSFEVQPESARRFRERVLQQAEDSLALEPDCTQFDVCADPERDNHFLLYERYQDEAAFQAHLQSDHFKAFDREVTPWVTDKQVRILTRL